MKIAYVIIGIAIVIVGGWYAFSLYTDNSASHVIGGDRDEHGCLVAAGYAFSEEVGACIRDFEMTPDIKQAAKQAIEYTGQADGLTVVAFNSYEEAGAYDITLEKGIDQERETILIRDGKVITPKKVTFTCNDNKSIDATFYIGYDKYVDLSLSDGRTLSVPRAISASGARYADAGESFVFWNKGDTAFITENGATIFADCVLKK